MFFSADKINQPDNMMAQMENVNRPMSMFWPNKYINDQNK